MPNGEPSNNIQYHTFLKEDEANYDYNMHASYISMLLALIILFASTSSAYRIRSYLNEQQEEYFPSDAVKETIPLEENIILKECAVVGEVDDDANWLVMVTEL
ncbi:unnamed protein product [Rotaria socialis]